MIRYDITYKDNLLTVLSAPEIIDLIHLFSCKYKRFLIPVISWG